MKIETFKIAAVFAFAATLSLTACNKNNDGGGSVAVAPGTVTLANCQGCFANPNVFIGGIKSSTGFGAWTFDLSVLVDPAQMIGFNMADPNIESYYQGSAALAGVMNVTSQLSSVCPTALGSYSVTTINPGVIAQGRINGLRLQANGPGGVIVMSLLFSELYSSNPEVPVMQGSASNRIGMNLQLESVNGVPCGLLATY